MGGPFNLVTITPPYEEVVYADLLKDVLESPVRYIVNVVSVYVYVSSYNDISVLSSVDQAVAEDTLIVVEYPVELGTLPFNVGQGRLLGVRNRRYAYDLIRVTHMIA
jgi:hypothetical protein